MLNLTRQEKSVLLFVALVTFVGITINYLKKHNPHFKEFLISHPQEKVALKININAATLDELLRLPGIGPEFAARILDYRKNYGRFKAIEEIKNVKGIGKQKFELIKDYISLEQENRLRR